MRLMPHNWGSLHMNQSHDSQADLDPVVADAYHRAHATVELAPKHQPRPHTTPNRQTHKPIGGVRPPSRPKAACTFEAAVFGD